MKINKKHYKSANPFFKKLVKELGSVLKESSNSTASKSSFTKLKKSNSKKLIK